MSADVSVVRRYAIVTKLVGQLQAASEDESKSDSKVEKDKG